MQQLGIAGTNSLLQQAVLELSAEAISLTMPALKREQNREEEEYQGIAP